MLNIFEVSETNKMIEKENLDVRTITLGISLLDCIDSDLKKLNDNIYKKITTVAKNLVPVGQEIEKEFGIPIVNKRISVTPIALIGGSACKTPEDFTTLAHTLDEAAKAVGVNLIGGYGSGRNLAAVDRRRAVVVDCADYACNIDFRCGNLHRFGALVDGRNNVARVHFQGDVVGVYRDARSKGVESVRQLRRRGRLGSV